MIKENYENPEGDKLKIIIWSAEIKTGNSG
jgi:hypothetical protein